MRDAPVLTLLLSGLALVACGSPRPPTTTHEPPATGSSAWVVVPPDADGISLPDDPERAVPGDHGTVHVTTTDECGMILSPIYFTVDAFGLEKSQLTMVDEVAYLFRCTYATERKLMEMEVVGHADASEHDPEGLSWSRAQVVSALLTAKGMPTLGPLQIRGAGTTSPLGKTSSESDRAKNRRVDFLILRRSP